MCPRSEFARVREIRTDPFEGLSKVSGRSESFLSHFFNDKLFVQYKINLCFIKMYISVICVIFFFNCPFSFVALHYRKTKVCLKHL